jgi:hypothetical protein
MVGERGPLLLSGNYSSRPLMLYGFLPHALRFPTATSCPMRWQAWSRLGVKPEPTVEVVDHPLPIRWISQRCQENRQLDGA